MKFPTHSLVILIISSLLWLACGGGQSGEGEQSNNETEQAEAETGLAALEGSGRSVQLTEIPVKSPESVISDGEFFYVSNVGEELKPSEVDGDGFIMKVDGDGNVVEEQFIEGLDAPKGSVIYDGTLYVADINKVKAFSLADGAAAGEIDFSKTGTMFLNDLVMLADGKMAVSATDINRIYEVDPAAGEYREIQTRPTLQGPNGLWYEAGDETLYVVTYPGEPTGRLYAVELSEKDGDAYNATPIGGYTGMLDGLAVVGDYAFISDWNRQTVVIMNMETGQVSGSGLPNQVKGPADFYFDAQGGEFWLPGMQENTISIQTLPVGTGGSNEG